MLKENAVEQQINVSQNAAQIAISFGYYRNSFSRYELS